MPLALGDKNHEQHQSLALNNNMTHQTTISTLAKLLISFAVGLVFSQSLIAANTLGPIDLRCEYHTDPVGIDAVQPRLSWRLTTNGQPEPGQRGLKQSAYRVLVASSLEDLSRGRGDLWDSGRVDTDRTIHQVYQGSVLQSRQQCFWKVMFWDHDDQASAWSDPARWSMGLLELSDWKSQWIGYDKIPDQTIQQNSKVVVTKAIFGVLRNKKLCADVTEKINQLVADGTYSFKVSNELFDEVPAFGRKKRLSLEYTLDGNLFKRTLNENTDFAFLSTAKPKLLTRRYLPSPHLRKDFSIDAAVKRAVVYVTAQGVVEMRLNGQRIGDEFLAPGWTDYRKRIYYRAYDVSDLLQSGKNTIGGILGDGWFRGNISIKGQNQYGDKLRLRAQLHIDYANGRSETIASDPSWKASFGPILQSDMHAGETFDARLKMPGWDQPGFNDRQWDSVDTGSEIDSLLQSYPGDPIRRTGELAVAKVTQPHTGLHVFDLGQNFSGWVRLKISGRSGDKVTMRFGEMLNPDGSVFMDNLRSARATDTYILKGDGEEIWEPHFTFHGFRYVEVEGLPNKPPADTITGVVIHTDAPMTSSFECSDPMLNRLHQNILWGQRSNYLEVPTDCPQRDERLGWTGDTQVFIRSGTYHQDVAAFFTKWMVDLADSRNPKGIYGNQAPVFHGWGSPGWSDAGVICPWTIYQAYGDKRILETHYDEMKQFIEACGRNGMGGLGRGFGDWLSIGATTPKDLISVAYYAYSTQLMAKIATTLGKTDDAKQFELLFEQLREHFQNTFVDNDGKIKGHTQTGYCMALTYDLLTDQQRRQAADHLVERIESNNNHLSVGFLGVSILLPALTEIGRSDLAYQLIQNKTYPSWGYSVEQGATTIWERWNSYTKDKGFNAGAMNSFNHYAYGACSEWMFASMLGIDMASPGYQTIRMKPEIGHGVTWAKGHYDSIHGRIASDWKIDSGTFRWNVTVPPNTTAVISLPTAKIENVTEGGQSISGNSAVMSGVNDQDRVQVQLGSGSYVFLVKDVQ